MPNTENFYSGADYGLDPEYPGVDIGEAPISHSVPASSIGTAVNAQTANQINAVSQALNTGVSNVEVQMTVPDVEKSIPNQHLEEINRLRKLTGAELTLHGPLIEPSGFNPQAGGWTEAQREQSERQLWQAVERGHKIDPDGNVVVTLHSSTSLPDPRTKVMTEDGKEVSSNLYVIDERTGRSGAIPSPKKDYLFGEEASVDRELKKFNDDQWSNSLSNISIAATRGSDAIESLNRELSRAKEFDGLKEKRAEEIYAFSKKEEGQKYLKDLEPEAQKVAEKIIDGINYGDVFIRDSYRNLQNLYNEAYYAAEKSEDTSTLNRLDKFKEEVAPLLQKYKGDPEKVIEMGRAVTKGIQILDSIEAPQTFQPLEKFGIDKSAETFANVALKGFKKFGDSAPVISIENPPVGTGLARAEDLKKLIEESRRKFVETAVESGISSSEAEQQAEKLIGATWDVGHINMLRQYGYTSEQLKEQTKEIAPYVKHVHLSDNFGMSHSELPMGLGNVPMKAHEELLKKYGKQVGKIKRVMEAADWIQHFGGVSPFSQTLQSYGAPVFGGANAPYWNQASGMMGGYYGGQGEILPNINFNTYGSTFATLPVELGGSLSGRSRLSGTPTE
jgi:hypothetical protein